MSSFITVSVEKLPLGPGYLAKVRVLIPDQVGSIVDNRVKEMISASSLERGMHFVQVQENDWHWASYTHCSAFA